MTTTHCLSGYKDHSNSVLVIRKRLYSSEYTSMKTRVTQLYSLVLADAELLDCSPIDAHHQTSRYGGGVASAKLRDILRSRS